VAIEFNCPRCGKLLTTTESRALALAKCPSCSDLITVPATSDPVSVSSGPGQRSAELAGTVAWSNAPTPGPIAPPSPFDRVAPVGTPAPAAAPYSGYTVGPGGFPAPPNAPPAPPFDGHAAPVSPGVPVSSAAHASSDSRVSPDAHASPNPHGAASAGDFVPMSPAGVIGSAFARGAVVTHGPGTTGLPPAGLHACPQCGQPAAPGAAYCVACGVPLSPAAYPLQFAGFFRRSLAAVIDLAIVSLASAAVDLVLRGESWQAFFFIWFFYSAALESSREQATIGKRAMRMFVCGADGRRLTFARAAIRTLAKLASLAICGMGFVMPLMTPRKQALHDMLTDAVVVLN
jgi:uncharacterized RDD family membrane protein YckC